MRKVNNSKSGIHLIKLGGSLITDKSKEFHLQDNNLSLLAAEISKLYQVGIPMIIGHGAGSFGHVVAKKFQTHKGWQGEESLEGIVRVAEIMQELNTQVVKILIKAGVPAVGLSPHTFMLSNNHSVQSGWTKAIQEALTVGVVPVVHGDVVLDEELGCTIISTERIFEFLVKDLSKNDYKFDTIVHCGTSDGVYDLEGKTIPKITPQTLAHFAAAIGGSAGTDVTGGMLHKVEEALHMAEIGIRVKIINAQNEGSLTTALTTNEQVGTLITK